jgi:hypothetical protein
MATMSNHDATVSRAPTFDELLAEPSEQFDVRSELLASVLTYLSAPPATAGTQPWHPNVGPSRAWLFAPSSTTGATTGGIAVA